MKEKIFTKFEKYLTSIDGLTKEQYNALIDLYQNELKEKDAKILEIFIDGYEKKGKYDYKLIKETIEDIIGGVILPKKAEPKKEINNIKDLFEEITKLNENANLKLIKEAGSYVILSLVDGKDLKLPENFYYNEKNGITNKHKTESGAYISIMVEKVEPKKSESKEAEPKKSDKKAEPKEIGPFKRFYYNKIKKYDVVDGKLSPFEVKMIDTKKNNRFKSLFNKSIDKKLNKILDFINLYYSDNDEIYEFMDLLEEREDKNTIIKKLYRFVKYSLNAYKEDKFVDKLYELFGLTRKKTEPKKVEPKKVEPKKEESKKEEPKKEEPKKEEKKVPRDITKMSDKYKIIMEQFRAEFTEQEVMFVDDAASECLEFGDQEFDQMLNQRYINKIRVYKCLLGTQKIKLLNMYDNLTSYEKMFVDDAIAEGLNPGDPEFDQMANERSVDKEVMATYFKVFAKTNEIKNKVFAKCKKDFLQPNKHSDEEIKKYATENAKDLKIVDPNALTKEELTKILHKLNVLKEQELEKKLGLRK